VVIGIGGVGANAVQGAKVLAAAMSWRWIRWSSSGRRRWTGRTHVATAWRRWGVVSELTRGQMADGRDTDAGRSSRASTCRPRCSWSATGGRVTRSPPDQDNGRVWSLGGADAKTRSRSGALCSASSNGQHDVRGCWRCTPRLLKLDELITPRVPAREINQGYQDMREGATSVVIRY